MESSVKHCILNASNGYAWYPKGTQRLKRSLIYYGFNGDILAYETWPNMLFDINNPYNVKPSAFMEALDLGYTHILWLDCSVWAIRDPNPIFDEINEKGYYFWSSGYNCAQVCSDACLDYFKVKRNDAEKMPDCSTSMFGLNLNNPTAKEFLRLWLLAAQEGAFNGSRLHDNQSQDPRFLFHRQDQSAASIILNKLGMKLTPPGVYSEYYTENPKKSTIFLMRGM